MNKIKPAACGIDCAECASYKATMEHDLNAAESLVPWYRSMGWIKEDEGADAVLKKVPLCKGCWNATDDCFFKCGCGKRDFRVCSKEKQIAHCGECADFPCEPYKEWASWHEGHQQAMERLMAFKTQDEG